MRLWFVSTFGGFGGWVVSDLVGWGMMPDANALTAWGVSLGGAFLGAALASIAWGRA